MDIERVLADLKRELELIDQAIVNLEPLMESYRGVPRTKRKRELRDEGPPTDLTKGAGADSPKAPD